MRYAEAARRLSALPERLPEGPAVLTPVLVEGPRGTPGDPPPWRPGGVRDGAVLVLVYPGDDGEAVVLLTERPTGDLRHSGEVCFPGGAIEETDGSVEAAALREAREEVGLDAEQAGLEIVALLDPVGIRVSNFRLTPLLALARRRPATTPDAREVASIVEAPLASFVPPAPVRIVEAERNGYRLRYGAYPVGDHLVWGATARVLGQLGALLVVNGTPYQGSPSDAS